MNREIKFRAWDKKNKLMWDVTEIRWRSVSQGREIFHIRGNADYHGLKEAPIGGHKDYCDMSQIILLQYTGLHDKNGKEIYESDIVQNKYHKGTVSFGYFDYDVGYPCGAACQTVGFGIVPGAESEAAGLQDYPHDNDWCYEIIGNIWENSELLDK